MSQRTDGGPAQPIREISGGGYGDRKALTEQQQGAPMPVAGGAGPPGGGGGSPGGPMPNLDIFGPTSNPDEPITAGAAMGPGAAGRSDLLEPDPNELLRVMWEKTQHPVFLALMEAGG